MRVEIRRQHGAWPVDIAPIGAVVTDAEINHENQNLLLALQLLDQSWCGDIEIPTPWSFTSCLLSLSQDRLEYNGSKKLRTEDLVGLEGATLSAIERGENQIDLVFQSIRISIDSE